MKSLVLFLLLVLFAIPSQARPRRIGLGVILREPNGISANDCLSQNRSLGRIGLPLILR